jgi:hypothetical protein
VRTRKIEFLDSIQKFSMSISILPKPILILILSEVGLESIKSISLVCKAWNRIANSSPYYNTIMAIQSKNLEKEYEFEGHITIPNYLKGKSCREIVLARSSIKRFGDQGFYEGPLNVEGQLEGEGVLYKKKTGLAYEGSFIAGKPEGYGKRIWPTLDTYYGEFSNTKKNGYGFLKLLNIAEHRGSYLDDQRSGKGFQKFDNGNIYNGDWSNDMTNGFGNFISIADGYEYIGYWIDNKRAGKGMLKYATGNYKGMWYNNQAHGNGRVEFIGGSYFEGTMVENGWNGFGTFIWNDGRKYIGTFVNGKQQGEGTIYFPNDAGSCSGEFRKNKIHGIIEIVYSSKHKYIGKVVKGVKNGFGTLYDEFDIKYFEGNFVNGELTGEGTYFTDTGLLYGEFLNGILVKKISGDLEEDIGKVDRLAN